MSKEKLIKRSIIMSIIFIIVALIGIVILLVTQRYNQIGIVSVFLVVGFVLLFLDIGKLKKVNEEINQSDYK